MHWNDSGGPNPKYRNNATTSVNFSQAATSQGNFSYIRRISLPIVTMLLHAKRYNFLTSPILILIDNTRSNYAVAASITELLKDLPESITQGSDKKGDSNRSSFCEDTPQQVKP